MSQEQAEGSSNPVGRPTKYKPEYCKIATAMCALGATDAQLADALDVSVSTVALWKVQHKEFSDARKLPKEEADDKVEQSLYRRAMGYEHDDVDIRVIEGQVVQTPIRKIYPPDTTAGIFWLKNRRAQQWRDKIEQEIKAEVTENIDKDDLTRRILLILSENLKAKP